MEGPSARRSHFRERFNQAATDAGMLLRNRPDDVTPLAFWVDRLYRHCLRHHTDFIRSQHTDSVGGSSGGSLESACEASATYCAWLDRLSLERSGLNKEDTLTSAIKDALGQIQQMEESIESPDTDSQYELDRSAAEQAYFMASVAWLEQMVSEAKTVSGTGSLAKPSTSIILSLVRNCEDYAKAELRSYSGLLSRSGIARSKTVSALERHALEVITETLTRKWNVGIGELSGLFDLELWVSQSWSFVEKSVSEYVREIEPDIWFRKIEVPPARLIKNEPQVSKMAPDPNHVRELTAEQKTIGRQLEDLRLRCGWTAEILAERVGLTPRSVYRHLGDHDIPSKLNVAKYQRVFAEKLEIEVVIERTSVNVIKRHNKS
jgi:hypothetical protein